MDERFKLVAPWSPEGDQPIAIAKLVEGYEKGLNKQCLMGVTGSGKTFTMACVIERLQLPVLVLAHNKTLAAQLYSEFKSFFPDNAVHYFASYYDYYQPEAYVPSNDIYIEKDASINEKIEKLRLATTKALLERNDVIVVSSVSCIYGIGKKKNYEEAVLEIKTGMTLPRREFFKRLDHNFYKRNDYSLEPGTFRVRGNIIDIFPAYSDSAVRVIFEDEDVEEIMEIDPLSGKISGRKNRIRIYPSQHYITSGEAINKALKEIEKELEERLLVLRSEGKLLEAQRLESRTRYDMEMLKEVGYCSGIENYSRYLDGREPGEQPGTLLDFFPKDFLIIIDESHITIPQIRGMYNGDRARKQTLVDYGFRLPSCLDNRPLKWEEFEKYLRKVCFVSATPGDWELKVSDQVVEQVVRPTGVVDPEVEVAPASAQVDDLVGRLKDVIARGERALVTTLTKRSAEDMAEYFQELGLPVKYIHSELDAFERVELLKELRRGDIAVLIGVNLLREGLDLPEVSLVAITDADREGFLRSHRSLIQMIGRAARNTAGKVVLYADRLTDSIRAAVEETERRRRLQMEFNKQRGIEPKSISKKVISILPEELEMAGKLHSPDYREEKKLTKHELERLMWEAVERLDFERAAEIRDIINQRFAGGEELVSRNNSKRRERT
jgi:excinuclease ABC subunit B